MKLYQKILFIILFIFIFIFTRVPRLNNDILSTDAVYWHERSLNFLNALKEGDYADTYQKYHPGVVLMWIMALTAEIHSIILKIPTDQVFAQVEYMHYYSKLTLVLWQLALSILLIFLLEKATKSWWLAFLSVVLFTLEPFYVGNSRLLHHDVQISLYALNGLTLAYLSSRKFSVITTFAAGLMFSMAVLSKTLFIGAPLFALGAGTVLTLINQGWRKAVMYFLILLTSFMGFYYLLFPAMWVDGSTVVTKILDESFEVGKERGHKQIFFGYETHNPGVKFYVWLFLLKLSLVSLFGIFAFAVSKIFFAYKSIRDKKLGYDFKNISFLLFIAVFYVVYFGLLVYFDKKVDRYIIPLYPFLTLVAVYGYSYIKPNKIYTKLLILIFGLYTIVWPLVKVFPHYMVYTNPVIGNAAKGNEIIGQKLFGIGIYELRDKIEARFGSANSVAINDPGPLQMIYPEGKVYNVLVEHPNSYKVMVLGPNKEVPKSVTGEPSIQFRQVDSVYIDGLEMWRIYKKL